MTSESTLAAVRTAVTRTTKSVASPFCQCGIIRIGPNGVSSGTIELESSAHLSCHAWQPLCTK